MPKAALFLIQVGTAPEGGLDAARPPPKRPPAVSGYVLAASLGDSRVTLLYEMIVNCDVGILTVQGYLVSEDAGDASRSYAERRIIWRVPFERTDLKVKPPEHQHPASLTSVAKVRIDVR